MFIFFAAVVALVSLIGILFIMKVDSHNHSPSSWQRVKINNNGQMVSRCSCGKTIKKYDDGWA